MKGLWGSGCRSEALDRNIAVSVSLCLSLCVCVCACQCACACVRSWVRVLLYVGTQSALWFSDFRCRSRSNECRRIVAAAAAAAAVGAGIVDVVVVVPTKQAAVSPNRKILRS